MIRKTLARLDELVFWLENRVIAAALAVMSVTVFMDVLHRRLSDPRSKLGDWIGFFAGVDKESATAATLQGTVAPALSLLMVVGLCRWVSGKWLYAGLLTGLLYGFGALVERGSSALVYSVVVVALFAGFIRHVMSWDDAGRKRTAVVAATLSLGLAGLGIAKMPIGYSWAQNFSLFLLLWVGFLGASVATRGRRHIQVDAFRKYVPERALAWYNAVSLGVAAAFTGFLFWIAYLYTFGPDGNIHHTPDIGRVPDWLVTGSLPVAFAIMSVRFSSHVVLEVEAARSGAPSPMGRHDEASHQEPVEH